jgi:hypothetical protein
MALSCILLSLFFAYSADRKVCPGYGFTTVPECKNTIFALLRKLSDLLILSYLFIGQGENSVK